MTLSIFQIPMNVLKEVIRVTVMLHVWILRAAITVCVTWDSPEVVPIALVKFNSYTLMINSSNMILNVILHNDILLLNVKS